MKGSKEIKHVLGARLKNARKALGESQGTFSKRFSVSTNTVSRWETGAYNLSPEVIWWLFHEGSTQVDGLRDLVNIQGANGNWNYDPYMRGMYNGMELMLAVLEGREPVYKGVPDQYLYDRPDSSGPFEEPVPAEEPGTSS